MDNKCGSLPALHAAVDGQARGRAAGEENARKIRQEQHVLRVVLQLLPSKAGLPAGGVPSPVRSPRVDVFLGKPVVGRGGCSSRVAQRVLAVAGSVLSSR